MRILSSIIILIILSLTLSAQSPHGKDFSTNCGDCHTTEGWKTSRNSMSFNHDTTEFALIGQHKLLDCKSCHKTLLFNQTRKECMACHVDVHEQTVGFECERCHTPRSWIVEDITEVHQQSRFPLVGPHVTADCYDCHASASLLRFDPLGVECYDCHQDDYLATTEPNHTEAKFSIDCSECHFITSFTWTGGNFNHSFFPLTQGHAISDCYQCHTPGEDYSNISAECVSCHETDYNNTINPVHSEAEIGTNCSECHTTTPGWKPANFPEHDAIFPIYSGEHLGTWDNCNECHTTQGNYSLFSCINCHDHNQADMDEEHNDVSGYIYDNIACLECHPTGSAENSFDHNASNFPLTGAHINTACNDCHTNGFSGTPTYCFACHEQDYNESLNPNHVGIGIPNTCETCHTTEPDWQPATFPIHNDYYQLAGAHATIANNCFTCHEGDYVNTPDYCYGCHAVDYDQTTDPPHASAQFSTSCETCHNVSAWTPATFDHDGQYFPIYSGEHNGEWNTCSECHPNPSDYGVFTCLTCHEQGETGNDHEGIGGYNYNSNACLECHPDGSAEGSFDHSASDFPLTGAHLTTDCLLCHENGYSGTPTYCFACHELDYNQSVNPNHVGLSIPNTCETCHTTNPGWQPALFPIHNDYYPLTGEHISVAADCFLCHQGDYNNTPNSCAGCHQDNYNQTVNPDHDAIAIPVDCEMCHTTSPDWQPASFPIHNNYWQLTGAHQSIANDCYTCHEGDYLNTPNACVGCHIDDYNQTSDPNHIAAQFPTECESCHNASAWEPATFDHDGQYFPIYSGEHNGEWNSCSECHENPGDYSIFTCLTCHEQGETGNDHEGIGGYSYSSPACLECHPDGSASGSFNHNNSAFPLTGAHLTTECIECHAEGYSGTPTICSICHEEDYNGSVNPNHNALGMPVECDNCHTTNPGWEPALFPIHDDYYPLTGEHIPVAADCFLCHQGDYNNTPNSCVGCHQDNYNQTVNPDHDAIAIPVDCEMCHTTSPDWQPASFPIHNNYWELTGAHQSIANDCYACHEGDYLSTPNTCVGCHLDDYNQTTDPNHASAQFPTDCELCHTTFAWVPSTFDHDGMYFPIYSGSHAGEWNSCSECHPNPSNYGVFTCLTCHEQGETDDDHSEVSGYIYDSDACLACHPNGEEEKNKMYRRE